MVNVIIAGAGAPFGVLEVDATRTRAFDEDDIAFLQNCANLLAAAIDRERAHRAEEDAAREQRLLAQELAHRVKNTLGLVQALVAQTMADEPGGRELRDSLLGRLQALARAEELLLQDNARVLDLAELAERALEPFMDGGRLVVEGTPLRLPARSGRILALVLHELATNATKYGALTASEGEVRLSWAVEPSAEGSQVRLRWLESGGPEVGPPRRRGFGTKLLTSLTEYELDGRVELNPRVTGLEYELMFPESAQ
jgi:two-component system CheB/CheR fusion protein